MSRALPFKPHELDRHPDGDRIRATIDAEIGERMDIVAGPIATETSEDELGHLYAIETAADRLLEAIGAGADFKREAMALRAILEAVGPDLRPPGYEPGELPLLHPAISRETSS